MEVIIYNIHLFKPNANIWHSFTPTLSKERINEKSVKELQNTPSLPFYLQKSWLPTKHSMILQLK